MTLTEKLLVNDSVVPFNAFTEQYGLAEFAFCPIWKRGKIVTLYIYPMQQPEAKYFYQVEAGFSDSLLLHSWTHKEMENPWIWRFVWCKDHKCQSLHAYVPRTTTQFRVSIMSSLAIIFEK